MAEIPIVDFACLGSLPRWQITDSSKNVELRNLIHDTLHAFKTTGFVYIKNHGITGDEILRVFDVAKGFFQLPCEQKKKFSTDFRPDNYHGWLQAGRQIVDPNEAYDLRESYDIVEPYNNDIPWPVETGCADFHETVKDFYQSCGRLAHSILDVISFGLDVEDRNYFSKTHGNFGTSQNVTSLRLLYYHSNEKMRSGQVRLGPHTDYGTITLLFQDQVGGLEVFSQKDGFVSAKPMDGTVLVNIGDLLQRWSSDRLLSCKHRVVVPDDEIHRSSPRQSVAFFVFPDNNTVVKCLDGSDKYPEVTALGYLNKKLSETYLY